jgi:lipopolysaccharide biosynthesis glycosyltransferase
MQAKLATQNRPAAARNAVVYCCDKGFLPFAALSLHTLFQSTPSPDFDVCLVSTETLDVPPAVAHHCIRNCKIDIDSTIEALPTSDRLSLATYMRLFLPEVFAGDYDRILYLDCDLLIVGEELDTVFSLDLHGTPLGAVTDGFQWKYPGRRSVDQQSVGFTGPYFNSGVLLIDCKTYIEQKIREKCIAAVLKFGHLKISFDQTVLNYVLQGNWARINPSWNWQWANVRSMFEVYLNLQIVHFVTTDKPWADPKAVLPAQYRERACNFLAKHYPEVEISAGATPKTLSKWRVVLKAFRHVLRARHFAAAYNANGGDINRVVGPDDPDY